MFSVLDDSGYVLIEGGYWIVIVASTIKVKLLTHSFVSDGSDLC